MNDVAQTPWERGRFDLRAGPKKILFGRMYEDPSIEAAAFAPGGRVMCIASAGCTAMALAPRHEVVALDINPDQLAYAERRIAGGPTVVGTAEKLMSFGRTFAPLVGWSSRRLHTFLDMDDAPAQLGFWERELDTRRFRVAVDTFFSTVALSAVYAKPFLSFLPERLGAVMRARMARCFARHPNRHNPYARLLLVGALDADPPTHVDKPIQLVRADAAEWLEAQPAASFDAFTISNILDGAGDDYRRRLYAALRRAARPSAMIVQRSFGEPAQESATNQAAADRSMLWGIVDVRAVAALADGPL